MIIDSDDDRPTNAAEPYIDRPEFDEEEEEYDSSAPYDSVVQTLDLPLGTAVLHLAFPHLPTDIQHINAGSFPMLFAEKLVAAVACSDSSIRIVTLPLTPPSHQSKARTEARDSAYTLHVGKSLFGEQMVTLSSGSGHQSIPMGISMSFTTPHSEDSEYVAMEDGDNQDENPDLQRKTSQSTSRSRGQPRAQIDEEWDLLVASHSTDLSGLLLIHRVPLKFPTGAGILESADHQLPWRKKHLASAATSVQFTSALYPAPEHCQVLVAEAKGSVRILDLKSTSPEGSCLVSLYTGFDTVERGLVKRKPILDAQWLLGGKAILVLLANCEWGVWDIGNVRPSPPTTAGNDVARSPCTSFAINGRIESSSKIKASMKTSVSNEDRIKFAPMTPGTRKIRQDALFSSAAAPLAVGLTHGGVCVAPLTGRLNGRGDDDSVLLWHGDNTTIIRSFYSYWQMKTRGSGGLFGSGAKGESKMISNLKLGGETQTEICLVPPPSRNTDAGMAFLVTAERHIILVTPPLPPSREVPARSAQQPLTASTDLRLLARGELDVGGMDRILAGMSDGQKPLLDDTPRQTKGKNLLLT